MVSLYVCPMQTEQVQYDQCNASAGSGIYDYNGFCTTGVPLMLELTENSQILMNTVNFENNHLYYFASKCRLSYNVILSVILK